MPKKYLIKSSSDPHIGDKGHSFILVCQVYGRQTNSFAFALDVANFLPPLASYVCTYVRAWVQVKHFYALTIDTAELAALKTQLAKC